MKPPQRRGPSPSAPAGALAARGAEALQQERFKEAVELFKQLVRQDPRPEWKESLAAAYHGRARALAAKGMFKEAAMVLENTLAPDGTLRDPPLYLACLIRDGQQQKAAAQALLHIGRAGALPAAGRTALEELTAALLVAVPLRPDPPGTASAERTGWLELAAACRDALAAWSNGAPAEEVERQLARISLRSAFRPVRLLLKSLATAPQDAGRARRLLEAIDPASPFFPFRQAVEAVLPGEPALDGEHWNRLTPAQQGFVTQLRGLPPAAAQFLARLSEAARNGPASLFAVLLKPSDLPRADLRSACLNLLPQVPDRVAQFEKAFGPLTELERGRVHALAAEARGEWGAAERFWRMAIAGIADEAPQAGLSRGVLYRHLAQLAIEHPGIEGNPDDIFADPVIYYLQRGCQADPLHVPTVLDLIGRYRDDGRDKDWHLLAEEAAQRFPADSQVLLAATESAVARKAYKKAAGFAHRLLKIDPINPTVRRQMIALQVAHARKQVRSRRPDLAAKELAAAAEWERPDAPSAPLRIARALVELQTGGPQAQAQLRAAVELAGGGAAGWFRAALEAELMKLAGNHATLLRAELARARETPPTREAVLAVASVLGQPEVAESKRAVAGLVLGTRRWLSQGAGIAWTAAEFQPVGEMLLRFEAFDVLAEFARAGRQREPANPAWRFLEIVARTFGDARRLYVSEQQELNDMAEAAARRQDFHAVNRIERFLSGETSAPSARRRRADTGPPDALDAEMVQVLIDTMMDTLPKGAAASLREMVADFGREGALAHMAEELRGSPLGRGMPEPVLQALCEALVNQAMLGGAGGKAAPGRRGRM